MPGRNRKPADQRAADGNPGHRPIPAELDFTAAGEIGRPASWLDKDAKKEYRRISTSLRLPARHCSMATAYRLAFFAPLGFDATNDVALSALLIPCQLFG
jgi:hypothetical protein